MRTSASSTMGEPFFGLALINLRRPWAQQKANRKGSPPVRFGARAGFSERTARRVNADPTPPSHRSLSFGGRKVPRTFR